MYESHQDKFYLLKSLINPKRCIIFKLFNEIVCANSGENSLKIKKLNSIY
jgi:hypothetical protein